MAVVEGQPPSGADRGHRAGHRGAQRRRKLSYQLIFAATWVVLIGAIVLALTTRFDWAFLGKWWQFILAGAEVTIELTVCSIILACVLAVLGALGRLSPNPVANGIASLYVSLIRGTPLLVQIFVWAFGLAELGLVLPLFWAGVIALGVNYGAYMTEIFRAGIQAVPARAARGGAGAGYARATHHASDRHAPSHPDRHPGHRQRLHRDDQGHLAGHRHRHPGAVVPGTVSRAPDHQHHGSDACSPRSSTGC